MKTPQISLKFLEPAITRIEKLVLWQRVAICAVVFILILGLYIWLFFLPKNQEVSKLGTQLEKLEKEVATAKKKAQLLTKYRKDMKAAQADFNKAKEALPDKKDIPELLSAISKSGQDSGLEFLLFEPKPEILKDFYAEIPVAMKVAGNFHNLVIFFDQISSLSRIVNVQNIAVQVPKDGNKLQTTCTAITYRFVDKPPPQKKTPTTTKKK
jgi:type IV pilus assembly protein PilO